MGRYVILLVAPIVLGVLVAAAVVIIGAMRERRLDARRTSLEMGRPDGVWSSADAAGEEESPHPTHRRIAS
jgi:hypothetical protein